MPKIGYLTIRGGTASSTLVESIRKLGWIEGQNVAIVVRNADDDVARLPALAAELLNQNVDLLVADGVRATKAAKQATTTVPIVMQGVIEPVGQGFVTSLSRPEGNITGLAWDQSAALSQKYPELLKEMVPGLLRIGCIIDPTVSGIGIYRDVMERAAQKLGLAIYHAEVAPRGSIEQAFAELTAKNAQALFVYGSYTLDLKLVAALAAKHRLPDMYAFREGVSAGGLMSYGVNWPQWHQRAGYFVDRILRGAKPADLPVEQPTTYELRLNAKTAKTLGLNIPKLLLVRADEVIY